MGLFSSLARLFRKIFGGILKAIWSFIKKYWMVILIAAAIWFAPVLATTLSGWGAPTFLVDALTWVGANITPTLTSVGSWLWNGVGSIAGSAWTAFKDAGLGVQAALALGAAAILAPEETSAVISDAVGFVADTVSTVGDALLDTVTSSPIVWVAAGLALWWLLGSSSSKKDVTVSVEPTAAAPMSTTPATLERGGA